MLTAAFVGLAVVQPVAVAAPAPAPVPEAAEAVDEASAQALAKRLDKPVRITGKTTGTDEFWAMPDGAFTWRQHQRPVRVRRDGGWVAADTTLERRADGTVAPKAATVELTLSGGGKGSKSRGPLVKMAHQGAEVGLDWEADLPVPVLDGPTATYPEVLPGVDLRVTADVIGFSEVLVVKTPEAAKNPKLRKVTFGSHTKNSRVRAVERRAEAASPGLEVVNAAGSVVFTGDATRMWDSSGDERREPRRAVMGVEVADGSVSIVPDQGFLTDPDTRYPVFLDPEYSCGACGKTHHAVVQSGYPTAKNFDATTGALSDLKAGYQTSDSSGKSRTYVQMNTSPLIGKTVDWATLNTTLLYSWWGSPTATPTQLHLAGWIDGNTTWGNQPGGVVVPGTSSSLLSSVNTTNQSQAPNVSMQFGASAAVKAAAAGGWGTTTFLLMGESETSTSSWRRFGLNPYLEVRYNSTPNNPTNHAMQNGTVPCVKGENRPYVFTRTPQLQAWVSDPDGGSLQVLVATSGGPYGADVPGTYRDNAATLSQSVIGTPGPNQGALAQVQVPAGWITTDGIHKWAMRVSDGALSSPRWDWDCEFYVNTTVPLAPTVHAASTPANQGETATFGISVQLATPNLYDIDRFIYTTDGSEPSTQGSPSVPATRTVRAGGGGGESATASLTTTAVNAQQNLIRVRAVNKAGTPGPDGTCAGALVTSGKACAYTVLPLTSAKFLKGAWALDDTSGTTASDNVAVLNPGETAHPATLTEAGWSIGYNRGNSWTQADAFGNKDGVKGGINIRPNGFLSTAGPVLDTSKSFSVASWVYLQKNDNWYTVLSQDGGSVSSFYLQYSSGLGKWSISTKAGDDVNSDAYRATSADATAVPAVNTWTHLIGTYDANSRQLSLYVDGKPAGSTVMATPLWNATGPFVIGAAKWGGARADHFPGQVDDVQAWQRVLSPQDAHNLATASAPRANLGLAEGATELLTTGSSGDEYTGTYVAAPVDSLQGYWKFDENAGTTAADSSNNGAGYENNLITTGATWAPGKSGSALHYDGSGHSQSTGPAVNTSQSFTVSAWVKLDDLNGYYAVAGQSGQNVSGFAIRYSPDVKAWIFGMTPADVAGTLPQWTYRSNSVTEAGVWTLVTGVYNNESKRVQLYVDGKLMGTRSFTGTPWNASGAVTVGAYHFGAMIHPFKGAIDSVQVWQQALTASQVAALAGLSYVDSVWNINGHTAGTATGGVSLVAQNGTHPAANASFTGASGTAVTAPKPRDFRANRSYTVEAWVRTDSDAAGAQAAVSLDDTTNSPFMLGYRKGATESSGRWAFAVACNRTTACLNTAYSDPTATTVTGKWTHIAGTYDAVTGKACLFVDGKAQSGCVDAPSVHDNVGPLVVGRGWWGGATADQWRGGVAGVRLYSGVRTSDQIKDDRTADDPGSLFGHVF